MGVSGFLGTVLHRPPLFPRPRQLIRSALKLFSIYVVHVLKLGAAGGILLRDLLGHILVSEIVSCGLLQCRLGVRGSLGAIG